MRFRKETIEWKDDSNNLSRKEQVVVSRLRMEYTRATHRHVIEKKPSPECPFCGVSFITEQILRKCTETTREWRETGTTKELWSDGTEGLKKWIEYYEENRIIPWKDCESQRTTKRRMQMDKNVNQKRKGKEKKKRKMKCQCDSAILWLKRVNKLIQIQNTKYFEFLSN
jgi:hypothetical protein